LAPALATSVALCCTSDVPGSSRRLNPPRRHLGRISTSGKRHFCAFLPFFLPNSFPHFSFYLYLFARPSSRAPSVVVPAVPAWSALRVDNVSVIGCPGPVFFFQPFSPRARVGESLFDTNLCPRLRRLRPARRQRLSKSENSYESLDSVNTFWPHLSPSPTLFSCWPRPPFRTDVQVVRERLFIDSFLQREAPDSLIFSRLFSL